MFFRRSPLQLICAAWLCLIAAVSSAQEIGPGSLSLNPRWDVVRTHSPRFFRAQLQWPLRSLLEGELQLECYIQRQLQCRYTSYETALSENGMSLGVVLPPPMLSREEDAYIVRAQFQGKDRTIYLDEHFVTAPVRWKRTMVVGLIEDRPGTIPAGMVETEGDTGGFFRSLQLEGFLPTPAARGLQLTQRFMPAEEEMTLLRGWQQSVTNVPPAELPADPLQLLAFDVLMVSTDQLTKLSPGQLEALRLWTQGGGSLAVSIAGAVPSGHERWMNQVSGGSREQPRAVVASDGSVTLLQKSPKVLLAYPGVGRSVLVQSPPRVDSSDWQQAMFHLWKLRSHQQKSIARSGRFQFSVGQDWSQHDAFDPLPWDVTFDANATTMTSLLLPESVQGVPLWLVCGVLVGCLLVVVPGDYFVLGAFRLQRWTWLSMPLIALGCSWFMVRTASSYMGNQDFVQSLSYVDLNADLEPVRCSQFQLSFPATSRTLEREFQGVLEVDLGEGRSAQQEARGSANSWTSSGTPPPLDFAPPRPVPYTPGAEQMRIGQASGGAMVPELVAPADVTEYFGTVPSAYSLRRHVNQWTPRVSRLTRFGLLEGLPNAVPQGFQEAALSNQGTPDAASLVAEISQLHPESAILCWQRGTLTMQLPSEASERLQRIAKHVAGQTSRADRGLFRIVSQVSPQGVQLTEDLALDVEQTVLVILESNADESRFVAWRRLIARGA